MKQNIWVVYGLANYAEYSNEDFTYDFCLTEEAAKLSVKEGRKEYEDHKFWIEKCTAHD